jgi:predicted nucleotidyltransferase
MSALGDGVRSARQSLIETAVRLLSDDPRVRAVWLAGSCGRGEADALSDVDLAVVVGAGGESLVGERVAVASRLGPLAAYLDSPQNAPAGGGQVNGLYNLGPLPLFLDLNLWPGVAERPSDVAVLFERDTLSEGTGSCEELLRTLPRGASPERTPAGRDHFRFMMITIAAKYAARGRDNAVVALYRAMGEEPPVSLELDAVLQSLEALTARLAANEPEEAVAATRRYLRMVPCVASGGGLSG